MVAHWEGLMADSMVDKKVLRTAVCWAVWKAAGWAVSKAGRWATRPVVSTVGKMADETAASRAVC